MGRSLVLNLDVDAGADVEVVNGPFAAPASLPQVCSLFEDNRFSAEMWCRGFDGVRRCKAHGLAAL